MNRFSTVEVLDIPLFDGSIPAFYNLLLEDIAGNEKLNRQVSFCDANVLVSTKHNHALEEILKRHTYINMPDGMPGVWIGKLKGGKKIERCYGPDLFEYVLRQSAGNEEITHYFSGGMDGVAEDLRQFCESELGNHNVVGVHCPPFRELSEVEIKDVANEINSKNVDLVWIGISSPKQDLYARRLCKYLKVHYIFTVGAAFDFYTGRVKQAPRFIQRSGFEWLFRLTKEPKRLWKRYLKVIPLFIFYSLEVVRFKKVK